ncbi:RidA family protein [Vibrio hyugaensis]|uniref:RidA family protein n=1 Tax=Vibrio hyugaensis TaxID=1534743 RepID=UPI000CE45A8B|nr:RidA family protein [Vibrio hyugaensis]
MIERKRGIYQGRNKSSAYKDLVWTVATSYDTSLDIVGQTELTLQTIENSLIELGSDKTRIVSAQVYIADMKEKPKMDTVWCEWMGANPDHWPQRACLGVDLEGDVLIEITVTAVRTEPSSDFKVSFS